jgi:hypothetical protein
MCLKAVLKTDKAPTEILLLNKYDKLCVVIDEIIHEVRIPVVLHVSIMLPKNFPCVGQLIIQGTLVDCIMHIQGILDTITPSDVLEAVKMKA